MPENTNDSGRIELNSENQETVDQQQTEVRTDQELVAENPNLQEQTTHTESTTVETSSNDDIPPTDLDENSRRIGDLSPKILATIAIVAGILVMVIGYTAFRYFNVNSDSEPSTPIAEVEIDDSEGVSDTGLSNANGQISSGVSTSRVGDWEDIDPNDYSGIVRDEPDTIAQGGQTGQVSGEVTQAPQSQPDSSSITQTQTTATSGAWVANDYSQGEIKSGSYTVVRGDTLWEIAEAVYGNGGEWHKIANANSVSNLANGNPLIVPGQVLNIPT